jgi:hypothetical protein
MAFVLVKEPLTILLTQNSDLRTISPTWKLVKSTAAIGHLNNPNPNPKSEAVYQDLNRFLVKCLSVLVPFTQAVN